MGRVTVRRDAGQRAETDRGQAMNVTCRAVGVGRVGIARRPPGRAAFADEARNAEIRKERFAGPVEHDVSRRHVAVVQTPRMDVGQRLSERRADRDHLASRQLATHVKHRRQTAALGIVEHQDQTIAGRDDGPQRDDVVVTHGREEGCLTFKLLRRYATGRVAAQPLERDYLPGRRVARAPNFARAAEPHQLFDVVARKRELVHAAIAPQKAVGPPALSTARSAHQRNRRPRILEGVIAFKHLGVVPYEQAWDMQRDVHAARVADEIPDTCLMLEHPPVFTAGRRTQDFERPVDGTPVIDVDRGGRMTWHGPGQLVGYPIVRLPMPIDAVGHVRRLEEALIAVCADFGVTAIQIAGRSGVWVPGNGGAAARKIAAIGVRISRCTTMHGFALNCDPDLSWFGRIVPCGIDDADVTSLSRELGRDVSVDEVLPFVELHLTNALSTARPAKVSA